MIEVIGNEPKQMSNGAAGYDVIVSETITIHAGETALVKTGTKVAIPEELCGLLMPRSSLGRKKGLFLTNGIGLIDSDYRGELMFSFFNSQSPAMNLEVERNPEGLVTDVALVEDASGMEVTLTKGERVGQLVLVPAMYGIPGLYTPVEEFSEETERGEGGFGSTGAW